MHSIRSRNNVGIHDRSPFAVLLYSIIRDKSFDLNELDVVFKQILELDLIKSNENFLIILPNPNDFQLVLNLMIKRNNNIDELSLEYVDRQYKVFFKFGKFFNLPTFTVSHEIDQISQSQKLLYNNIVYLYNSSVFMSVPISKSYISDAAFDLTLEQDYLIKPLEKVKLLFVEKIVIPLDHAGFLCARSSINSFGCLRIGLIDATFNGQLSAVFIADQQEVSFKKGQRVAQLVIFPIASQLPVVVSAKSLLPSLFRGKNCFGSTGQF